jgi:mannose-6-phosphate isomerase-like protein (cupin superfamily)
MEVTRYDSAPQYVAPKHHECYGLRVQGFEVSKSRNFWMGISHFLPTGGAEKNATPVEKIYFVLEGEVTIITDDGEVVLGKYDSCYLAPNESRGIENRTNSPATMLVAIPYPEPREF